MGRNGNNWLIPLRRNWLASFLFRAPHADYASNGLVVLLRSNKPAVLVPYGDISRVEAKTGWLWDTITIVRRSGGESLSLRGISHTEVPLIESAGKNAPSAPDSPLQSTLRRILAYECFVSAYDHAQLEAEFEKYADDGKRLEQCLRSGAVPDEVWQAGLSALATSELYARYADHPREDWNAQFVKAELERIQPWVKERFSPSLTDEQLRAVVNNEDNQLVVAGAGTGKTTTVIGKIAYLVECRKVPPERILVVAFNRDAAAEVRTRLERFEIPVTDKLEGPGVVASTYHALGGNLVREVGKIVRKKVSRLDEDKVARDNFVQEQVLAMFLSKDTHADVRDFFAYYSTPIGDARDYPSMETYVQSEGASNLRTLRDGELVKSHGERLIANWLYLHGIEYAYEKQFEFPKGNPQNQRYLPDFTIKLPESSAYIEYYGVDAEDRTAPGIDRVGYLKSREWKRKLHAQHETKCIELTYAQLKNGTLFTALSKEIEDLTGTPTRYITLEAVQKHFIADKSEKQSPEIETTAELLNRFLTLFRANVWTLPEIREHMTGPREACFFRIFSAFLARYMKALDAEGATDFAGMIAEAIPLCQSLERRFDHIIVDEFQDISRGREMFLRALLDLTPGRRLCAVGDDWQSIYRFTGSDVSVMTGFNYGTTTRTDLKQSFRFNERLQRISSKFIQKNPAQLRKQITANRWASAPAIFLLEYDGGPESPEHDHAHAAAVDDYLSRFHPKKPDVLFLTRYNHGLAKIREFLSGLGEKVGYKSLTVHRSKGLEADCVILSGVSGGRIGFPCAREDDPLIKCVLTDPDEYPHAEERRLFYVALTRAKSVVYILAPRKSRSLFVTELLEDFASDPEEKLVVHLNSQVREGDYRCPVCRGQLVPRTTKSAPPTVFWSCENSPACYYTTDSCPTCHNGPLLPPEQTHGYLRCVRCGNTKTIVCPKCRLGGMVQRKRQSDGKAFWACSFFAKTGCSYSSPEAPQLFGGPNPTPGGSRSRGPA